MQPSQQSPAFLLDQRPLGESDRLLVYFTQREGKVRGVARGAQRSRKRFGGSLDFFHLVRLQYRPGRSDLVTVEGIDLIEGFPAISGNLAHYAYASYYVELVREMTRDHHAEEGLFDLLHWGMRTLSKNVDPAEGTASLESMARFFELALLEEVGLRPNLASESIPKEVREELQRALHDFRAAQEVVRIPTLSPTGNRQARRFLHAALSSMLQRPLKSLAMLRELAGNAQVS